MGTSGSSSGSPSGTPIVPPWVSDPGLIDEPASSPSDSDTADQEPRTQPEASPIAPVARFRAARLSFGDYAKSGGDTDLRKGLKAFVGTGYGGSKTAARRFEGTTRTAGSLFNTLSAIADKAPTLKGTDLDPGLLKGKTARQIIGAIVDAVRPSDGTQDAEASKDAVNRAFSELFNKYPEVDLLNLSIEERFSVLEYFLGNDIYNRICLDVGKIIQAKAPSSSLAQQRLGEIKQYIKSEVARVFRDEQKRYSNWNSGKVRDFVSKVISKTLNVFEDYL